MLTIRFSRIGKKKKPFFRLIISEKTKDTKGNYLELLGHYDPRTKEATLKADRIKYWIKVGATVSNSVFNLLLKEKVIDEAKKRRSVSISKKRIAKQAKTEKQASAKAVQPDDAKPAVKKENKTDDVNEDKLLDESKKKSDKKAAKKEEKQDSVKIPHSHEEDVEGAKKEEKIE